MTKRKIKDTNFLLIFAGYFQKRYNRKTNIVEKYRVYLKEK